MRTTLTFLRRNAFLLLLVLVLLLGDLALTRADPVRYMTSLWRSDYELIALDHPNMTFDRVFFWQQCSDRLLH